MKKSHERIKNQNNKILFTSNKQQNTNGKDFRVFELLTQNKQKCNILLVFTTILQSTTLQFFNESYIFVLLNVWYF